MASGEVSWLAAEAVTRWKEQGLAREGASPAALVDAEVRLDLQLPDELAELLLLADGMLEGEMDDLLVRFWSASELKAFDGHVLFADFSLCAHGYAIDVDTGAVVIVGGPQPMLTIAVSLTDFLKAYLTHHARLFPDLRDEETERTVA
jgi:hypothetical protein